MMMIGIETAGLREQSPCISWLGKLETKKLTGICKRVNAFRSKDEKKNKKPYTFSSRENEVEISRH